MRQMNKKLNFNKQICFICEISLFDIDFISDVFRVLVLTGSHFATLLALPSDL